MAEGATGKIAGDGLGATWLGETDSGGAVGLPDSGAVVGVTDAGASEAVLDTGRDGVGWVDGLGGAVAVGLGSAVGDGVFGGGVTTPPWHVTLIVSGNCGMMIALIVRWPSTGPKRTVTVARPPASVTVRDGLTASAVVRLCAKSQLMDWPSISCPDSDERMIALISALESQRTGPSGPSSRTVYGFWPT